MTNKRFRTSTYGELPLKINTGESKFQLKRQVTEVFASIDEVTGEVKFFISPEELEKLKENKIFS